MSKVITSLFDHSQGRPVLHWELEGVMLGLLIFLGVLHLLPIEKQRRNKLVLWSILGYYIYLAVLMLVLFALVIWEQYATS